MPSCLGLYIEDNLIKYAKISKDNETVKVESFGVKFYENLENVVKQIIEETYSSKIPISINTTDEWYNDISVFNLLTKKDMLDAIKTEFENICYEKDINQNIYEQRHVFTNHHKNDEKIKAIHIAVPKVAIEQRRNQFSQYKINSIVPTSISIASLLKKDKKINNIIINIEENTTVTKVLDGIVSDVRIIETGAKEILEKIKRKENSYSKAYEICKNSTIYTENDNNLEYEENEYLEDIMPTLFQIMNEVKNVLSETVERIDNIYITGTGAVINNIDIYFQDYLKEGRCEILKPSFINNNSKINIKDYIEVNSAIAIALQGLEKNNSDINFKKESSFDFSSLLKSNISDIDFSALTRGTGEVIDRFYRQWDLFSVTLVMSVILYVAGSTVINNLTNKKTQEVITSIAYTNQEISKIQEYDSKFNSQKQEYMALISNIEDLNNLNSEDKRYKHTIPNLLNNIMAVIPEKVQIISIENTRDTHIVITARTKEFQQMAYFKTKLKEEEILKNVVSDTGVSKEEHLVVTIEGELP